jgi:hypothetical protein
MIATAIHWLSFVLLSLFLTWAPEPYLKPLYVLGLPVLLMEWVFDDPIGDIWFVPLMFLNSLAYGIAGAWLSWGWLVRIDWHEEVRLRSNEDSDAPPAIKRRSFRLSR